MFPLVRTEQMASARNQFEDQIRQYQDQITALQSQRGAQVNKRFNDLRTQELQYGLNRAQFQLSKIDDQKNYQLQVQKAKQDKVAATRQYNLDKQQYNLDKLKSDRDYEIAKRTAGDEEKKIQLMKDQNDMQWAQISGKLPDGSKTLDQQKLDETAKESLRAYGLSEKEANARIADAKATRKMQLQKFHADQKTEWADLLENALNPKAGASVTHTATVDATGMDLANSNAFADPNSSTGYSKIITWTTQSPIHQAITDPTKLVDYLRTVVDDPSMTKARAIELVKARMGGAVPADWKYGDKWPPKGGAKPIPKEDKTVTPVYGKQPGKPKVKSWTDTTGKVHTTTVPG